jgi:hypothetical protein
MSRVVQPIGPAKKAVAVLGRQCIEAVEHELKRDWELQDIVGPDAALRIEALCVYLLDRGPSFAR